MIHSPTSRRGTRPQTRLRGLVGTDRADACRVYHVSMRLPIWRTNVLQQFGRGKFEGHLRVWHFGTRIQTIA